MMCKWGTYVNVDLPVRAEDSHTGKAFIKSWPIDACIAPIVQALHDAGIVMLGSCCGHGEMDGVIGLADGRELRIITPEIPGGSCIASAEPTSEGE